MDEFFNDRTRAAYEFALTTVVGKEELSRMYELTLAEAASVLDAVECWHNLMEW